MGATGKGGECQRIPAAPSPRGCWVLEFFHGKSLDVSLQFLSISNALRPGFQGLSGKCSWDGREKAAPWREWGMWPAKGGGYHREAREFGWGWPGNTLEEPGGGRREFVFLRAREGTPRTSDLCLGGWSGFLSNRLPFLPSAPPIYPPSPSLSSPQHPQKLSPVAPSLTFVHPGQPGITGVEQG